ncbi:hypothetical protein D3C73_1391930 [compost metagenome]
MLLHGTCDSCHIFGHLQRCIAFDITDTEAAAEVNHRELYTEFFLHFPREFGNTLNRQLKTFGFKNL